MDSLDGHVLLYVGHDGLTIAYEPTALVASRYARFWRHAICAVLAADRAALLGLPERDRHSHADRRWAIRPVAAQLPRPARRHRHPQARMPAPNANVVAHASLLLQVQDVVHVRIQQRGEAARGFQECWKYRYPRPHAGERHDRPTARKSTPSEEDFNLGLRAASCARVARFAKGNCRLEATRLRCLSCDCRRGSGARTGRALAQASRYGVPHTSALHDMPRDE